MSLDELWKWLAGGAASLASGGFAYHRYIDAKIGKKADKEEMTRALGHIEKLYENAEADRRLTRDLHDKAMERIQENQMQIVEIVSRK